MPAILCAQQKLDKQAHRGGAGLLPENTIEAARNALRLGTTIEMDLYMSKDSQIVVTYDPHIVAAYALHPDGRPVTKEEEKGLVRKEMD
ncbi:MAG: glycerophosphodiester phosphodiesterase family protein [Pedobacter sp.]